MINWKKRHDELLGRYKALQQQYDYTKQQLATYHYRKEDVIRSFKQLLLKVLDD